LVLVTYGLSRPIRAAETLLQRKEHKASLGDVMEKRKNLPALCE